MEPVSASRRRPRGHSPVMPKRERGAPAAPSREVRAKPEPGAPPTGPVHAKPEPAAKPEPGARPASPVPAALPQITAEQLRAERAAALEGQRDAARALLPHVRASVQRQIQRQAREGAPEVKAQILLDDMRPVSKLTFRALDLVLKQERLVDWFPGCQVSYDYLEGIDPFMVFRVKF